MPPFAAIYREYFDFVWASARRLGVSEDAMDDVVQEVFIVIHAKLPTLKQPDALRSWIYGIVRRTVQRHHRVARVRRVSGAKLAHETIAHEVPPPTPSDLAEAAANVELLFALLAKLDESKREVLALVELEQMTVPEVAQALEIPLNTAYSRLRLAREEFEAVMARHSLVSERRPG